jgi:hypothetical protein
MTGHVYVYNFEIPATPPSLNVTGSRGSWRKWHRFKTSWQRDLGAMLMVAGVPRGLTTVSATAELRFPIRRGRDSDNHTALIAKALGDALVAGRYLPEDTADRYTFTPVAFDPKCGPARTRVTLEVSR